MREIVLDTETTGFDPDEGHRLIEIGCVELHDYVPTGRVFHKYINPERDVPAEAVAVHGLTAAFLSDKPIFSEVVDEFLSFIGPDQLVIHNAEFDLKFLNAELKKTGFATLKNPALDTVMVARKMFPGQPASLDALCRRYKIDLSGRDLHGALLDARLLADVYLELMGGRQVGLMLGHAPDPSTEKKGSGQGDLTITATPKKERTPRTFAPSDTENAAHIELVAKLGDDALWKKWIS